MVKKQITLDGLAGMIKRGFDEMNGKMATKSDIARIDVRMDKLDTRMDRIEARLSHMDARLSHMDARIAQIERDTAEIRKGLISKMDFEDLMSRVKYLELKLGIKSGK